MAALAAAAASAAEGQQKPPPCPFFFDGVFVNTAMELDGTIVQDNHLVMVLFAASWCVPSVQFVTLLIEAYGMVRKQFGNHAMEVVLVPRERTESQWSTFLGTMPWLSLPWDDPRIAQVKEHFNITRVPQLIVLDSTGTVVTTSGRGRQGFGFCCDPLHAYYGLVDAAGLDLRTARRRRTVRISQDNDSDSDLGSDSDKDESGDSEATSSPSEGGGDP